MSYYNSRQYNERTFYWGAMTLESFELFLKAKMSGSDYNIFFYLCQNLDRHDNFVNLTQKEIEAKLEISKGTVSKSINKLIKHQLIVRKRPGFVINPSVFYVGNSKLGERKALRRNFENLIIASGDSVKFYMDEDNQKFEKGRQDQKENINMPFESILDDISFLD